MPPSLAETLWYRAVPSIMMPYSEALRKSLTARPSARILQASWELSVLRLLPENVLRRAMRLKCFPTKSSAPSSMILPWQSARAAITAAGLPLTDFPADASLYPAIAVSAASAARKTPTMYRIYMNTNCIASFPIPPWNLTRRPEVRWEYQEC